MAGYSGTPLLKKLGIKEQFACAIFHAPEDYSGLLGPLPEGASVLKKPENVAMHFVHYFTKEKNKLEKDFPALNKLLLPAGMLWISWPKKSSGVVTDLTEDIIRAIGLEHGLVDVKVCAVDDVWSALKFVYRVKDR